MCQKVLHNDSGPSVLYADGYSVYSIDGHRVNEQIVMRPETLTIEQIHEQNNADIQTIMVDRFGWDRYTEETEAELIDERKNLIENTYEALYRTERFGLRIFLTCPTGRVFVKGVDESELRENTCEEVQNWMSGYSNIDGREKYTTIART